MSRVSLPGLKRREASPNGTMDLRQSKAEKRKKERLYFASQWRLIWWKFQRHRLAVVSLGLLLVMYLVAAFAQFFSPYLPDTQFPPYRDVQPQQIHLFSESGGSVHFDGPYVEGLKQQVDLKTLFRSFAPDPTKTYRIHFFMHGPPYRLWGIIPTDLHLYGTDGGQVFLFGSDGLNRDLFSRILYGAQISLTIGLVGIFISFLLGLSLGGISGYFGGLVDEVVQRSIDFLISVPTLPLWMALSAALPRDWSVTKTYLAITIIFSIVGWTGLARVVRGKLLSLREEEFAIAAKVAGASDWRIISKHLLPLFFSYIVVAMTMSVPGMILGETSLSFIGLGMQPPAVSWGVLLQDAQSLTEIVNHSWKLIPAGFVVLTVLLFNFLGDGLRDAADPYVT
jgi:peptide/nickel transport system permease protein